MHWIVPLVVLGVATESSAADVRTRVAKADVNWTRGLVIASGAASANLRAPRPEVARVGAVRRARELARRRLTEAVHALPMAQGSSARNSQAAKARLATAVARALTLAVNYGSDGSASVRMAVPIEAVRVAVFGTPAPPSPGAKLTAVIVEAPAGTTPAIGYSIAAGPVVHSGPAWFVNARQHALADRRVGPVTRTVRAAATRGGRLRIEGAQAASVVRSAKRAGAVIVVVVGSS